MYPYPHLGHGAQPFRKPLEIRTAQFEIIRVRDTAGAGWILESGWQSAGNYPDASGFEGSLDLVCKMLRGGSHQCGAFDKWPQLRGVCGGRTGLVGRMIWESPKEVIDVEYVRNIPGYAQAQQLAK